MKQPLIFLISLIPYLWFAVALGNGWTNFKQGFFLKQKTARSICLDTGGCTGMQAVEVPTEIVGFFTSKCRANPEKVHS